MDKQANVTPKAESNILGLTLEAYKGKPSTLCPGCGHNMISNQIQAAVYELGLLPEKVVKFSGIGCSSKSPNYFLQRSFGFNGLHGRMPTLVTGAAFADRSMKIIGISGDGDSASIGLGHFKHLIRRNVPMAYIIENNGVYGLTKGQFSATSDLGLELKHQGKNWLPPLDLCMEALISGATFVARSFAGDAKQLKELIKSAIIHNGISVIDVISPCVTFNNKDEALQSYNWGRQHEEPIQEIKFALKRDVPNLDDFEEGAVREVTLPDESVILLKKIKRDYDPTDHAAALDLLTESYKNHYFATGLIYINNETPTAFEPYNLSQTPLNRTPIDLLRPSPEVLDGINAGLA
ncbi:MAG: 2-oxoacid:ferredoxin oxidoreductase subunit beta [Anaerolineaceae bacterium]|nr:2-oxoacid:ferredoxin oxidoreductase subunit beta [Anaerolineaceae bacterium]